MASDSIIRDLEEKDIIDLPSTSFAEPTASGFPLPKKRASAFKRQRHGKPEPDASAAVAAPSAKRQDGPPPSRSHAPAPTAVDERRGIDEENQALLNNMTAEEIAEAQKELYNNLDPKLLQMLLRRANLDDPAGSSSFDSPFDLRFRRDAPEPSPSSPPPRSSAADPNGLGSKPRPTSRHVTIEDAPEEDGQRNGGRPDLPAAEPASHESAGARQETEKHPAAQPTNDDARSRDATSENGKAAPTPTDAQRQKRVTFDEDAPPPVPPPNLFPIKDLPRMASKSTTTTTTTSSSSKPKPLPQDAADPSSQDLDVPHNTHFPAPPPVPDLDPSDPDFLDKLHKKYFPTLPADPSKMAWMAPLPTPDSPADRESPYYPGQSSLPVSALRFDFRGRLVPPRLSRALPVTLGLHHHGEAPEAAGYTIPELATLARSAVAAQRCLAYQTLGRIMYRLGKGEFGGGANARDGTRDNDDDDGGLAVSIWRLIQQGKVVEGMEEMAAGGGIQHMSAYCYAVEALWLLDRGGWQKRWKAT
ncbi:hypothetical protein VTJ83DRAFT_3234 [Remersonia thermophila]|uniref:Uncharacterized protein n=1 Tax=Remersonia thermophila TaxID=72144 RepID=A0ABR4DDF7_9PEZI